MQAVVQTQGLCRYFGSNRAVDDLTFDVYAAEVFGFLGHNGAGKTTTVRLLNGVFAPTSGRLEVLGLSPVEDGPALRKQTGVLTETPALDERLTAYDNLSIYASLYGVADAQRRDRVHTLLAQFDLADRATDKVSGFSKGMKQRLALARALVHDPRILFLDEPTAGLDPVATAQVHELIRHLSQDEQRTVFICTHNLNEAQRLCHRVGVMEQGRLIAIGQTDELAQRAGIQIQLEIEVEAAQLVQAAQLLRNHYPDLEIAQQEQHLSIRKAERAIIPELIHVLVNNEMSVFRVSPETPSLEDVYFALQKTGPNL